MEVNNAKNKQSTNGERLKRLCVRLAMIVDIVTERDAWQSPESVASVLKCCQIKFINNNTAIPDSNKSIIIVDSGAEQTLVNHVWTVIRKNSSHIYLLNKSSV